MSLRLSKGSKLLETIAFAFKPYIITQALPLIKLSFNFITLHFIKSSICSFTLLY